MKNKSVKAPVTLFLVFIAIFLMQAILIVLALNLEVISFIPSMEENIILAIAGGISAILSLAIVRYLSLILKTKSEKIVLETINETKEIKVEKENVKNSVTENNNNPKVTDVQPVHIATKPVTTKNKKPTMGVLAFKFIENNTATSCTIKSFSIPEIIIPQINNGFPVHEINVNLTNNQEEATVTSVTLPHKLKEIAPYTFNGLPFLKEVYIPDGLESIGISAFEGCKRLQKIYIPASVKRIASSAFKGCNILEMYCQAPIKPDGWDTEFKDSNVVVYWNQTRA